MNHALPRPLALPSAATSAPGWITWLRALPPNRRWYLTVTAISILTAIVTVMASPFTITFDNAPTLLLLTAFTTVGLSRMVEIGPRTKTGVGVASIYAAVLLYGPEGGMWVTALGATLAFIIKPYGKLWSMGPTVAVITFAAAIAGWVVQWVADAPLVLQASNERAMVAMGVGALTMYLANTLPVVIATDIQLRRPLLRSYLVDQRERWLQYLALCVLGILAALVGTDRPWAIALVALPVLIVSISLEQTARIRRQTWEAIEQLADMVDLREPYTAQHSRRVEEFTVAVCRVMGLGRAETETITQAARVHDVGKLAMSGSMVSQPRALTDAEWQEMRRHPEIGASIVGRMSGFADGAKIVLHHHERWDGKGYPMQIAGEAIPLGARIIAVCDTFDAMTSDRSYRKGMDTETALAEVARCRGTQFDPRVADAFLKSFERAQVTAIPAAAQREPVAA